MALNLDSVGKTTAALTHEYTWKDAVLYALGCGATKETELDFLFEGSDGAGPKVLPTYAVVPTFPVCAELFKMTGGDMLGVVHGSRAITLHKPFTPAGKLTTVGKVEGVYDLKRMAQAVFTTETRDESNELVCETEWGIIFRLDGGFDGPRPPKTDKHRTPEREPDFVVEEKTSPEQALLYRLSGDLNPLHADPAIGEKAGFGQPILHGLCTFGYAGRAVIAECCDGDPAKLATLSGQFRRPVWPGDTLITSGWREEGRVILQTRTAERPDEMSFTNAQATLR